MVILLQKSIRNSVGERRKEAEDFCTRTLPSHTPHVSPRPALYIVISFQKSILNSVEERGEEVEDVGEFSFEVRPEFFDGIEVRKIGRQVN
jgi:hypothetical protein